jgi:acetyltransferase-like isoleucine patch superfamily enzyme
MKNIPACLFGWLPRWHGRLETFLNVPRWKDIYKTSKLRSRLREGHPGLQIQHPICIEHPECVSMGKDVSIAAFVHIWGGGGVTIGDRVLIASHVAIASETHDHRVPDMRSSKVCKAVRICDGAWIGAHACILPGVTIGRGAVVGAGAVVTKDVPDACIVAGVPARVMARRCDDLLSRSS